MIRIRTAPTPDKLAIGKSVLFALLTAEALALFVARLPGTLQFDNFAFFDTGANLSVQYLIKPRLSPDPRLHLSLRAAAASIRPHMV